MKLNPLITKSIVFTPCLDTKELNNLKDKLSLNAFTNPVKVVLHNKTETGELTYVALFCDSVFYVIRYPDALKDPTEYMNELKNNTFDVFCFPYSTVTGMAVMAPNPKQFVRPCLFIGFAESEDLEFAIDDKSEVLYHILNLYHTNAT